MKKKIYFDMDGTFYNLYGYENWLECILSEKTSEDNCVPVKSKAIV